MLPLVPPTPVPHGESRRLLSFKRASPVRRTHHHWPAHMSGTDGVGMGGRARTLRRVGIHTWVCLATVRANGATWHKTAGTIGTIGSDGAHDTGTTVRSHRGSGGYPRGGGAAVEETAASPSHSPRGDWPVFFFLRTPETANCGPSTDIHATQIRMGVVCVKCCSGTHPMASGLVASFPPNWHSMGVRMNVPKGS